ncbi:hypothetical protein LCL95_13570 [Bacillus timonensis]|nr:hypothetical protein [Bacillus timonensis]
MNKEEWIKIEDKVHKLAHGVGLHLETLQGQIHERLEQIEKQYEEKFNKFIR